jgi:hypothetical protein
MATLNYSAFRIRQHLKEHWWGSLWKTMNCQRNVKLLYIIINSNVEIFTAAIVQISGFRDVTSFSFVVGYRISEDLL